MKRREEIGVLQKDKSSHAAISWIRNSNPTLASLALDCGVDTWQAADKLSRSAADFAAAQPPIQVRAVLPEMVNKRDHDKARKGSLHPALWFVRPLGKARDSLKFNCTDLLRLAGVDRGPGSLQKGFSSNAFDLLSNPQPNGRLINVIKGVSKGGEWRPLISPLDDGYRVWSRKQQRLQRRRIKFAGPTTDLVHGIGRTGLVSRAANLHFELLFLDAPRLGLRPLLPDRIT
jgi:hypothetical protein